MTAARNRDTPLTTRPCPPLRLHSPTGQARVRWSVAGKRFERYFGRWGEGETNLAYARFAAEWAADRGPPPPGRKADASVGQVWVRFSAWARGHYVKAGRLTSEFYVFRAAAAAWVDLYGGTPAAEFRPAALRALRERWVAAGHARETVNRYAAKVVAVLSWAVSHELVPAAVLAPLREVAALRAGRTAARDPEPVGAVPLSVVEATVPHLHPDPARRELLEAMIRVQLAARMRPGELCAMTPEAVDASRTPWRYDARAANKNLHRGKPRVVFLGPRARALLAPVLAAAEPRRPLWLFPPAPAGHGHAAGRRTAVTRLEYGRFVARACARAGVAEWTPNQLRHRGATEVMERLEDIEAVAAALGNTPEVARQVYVERPGEAVAARIAEATG